MIPFRLIATGLQSAAMNMAIDEAVLEKVASGESAPALRFYGWNPVAVSIGYFQSLEDELDLDACASKGVEHVRRMTGGGAVFHEHELTYSMHIPENLGLVPDGILASYRKICEGVTSGLARFKLESQFVPLNDIVLKDPATGLLQKISGNAQTRRSRVILQHGTILLKVDVDKMFTLLKVPDEKLKGKMIDDVKKRVTSVSGILGREIGFEEALQEFSRGFMAAFPEISFEKAELTEVELDRARELYVGKYMSDHWNRKR